MFIRISNLNTDFIVKHTTWSIRTFTDTVHVWVRVNIRKDLYSQTFATKTCDNPFQDATSHNALVCNYKSSCCFTYVVSRQGFFQTTSIEVELLG